MLNLGLLGLANPWLLTALISLPVLWWLLRVIPPAPKRLRFPTIRFLLGLQPEEETSARTPPWLLVLRLLLATLLILALAGPVLNPEPELSGEGPLVLAVDDGWAAAPRWEHRLAALERFTARAQRQEREVILLSAAPDPAGSALRRLSAADAARGVSGWLPKPWPVDHDTALAQLEAETFEDAEIIWLSDGIAEGRDARASAARFGEGLQRLGPLRVFVDPANERAMLQRRPEVADDALLANLRRPAPGPAEKLTVRALGPRGEVLARAGATFEAQALEAQARIELPLELRNRIARLEVEPPMAVGRVALLGGRWRRTPRCGVAASRSSWPARSPASCCRTAPRSAPTHVAGSPAGWTRAACCCALRGPGLPMPGRTIWCRSPCGAAIATSTARCPGRGRWRSPASTRTVRWPGCRSRKATSSCTARC